LPDFIAPELSELKRDLKQVDAKIDSEAAQIMADVKRLGGRMDSQFSRLEDKMNSGFKRLGDKMDSFPHFVLFGFRKKPNKSVASWRATVYCLASPGILAVTFRRKNVTLPAPRSLHADGMLSGIRSGKTHNDERGKGFIALH
jgi:hypothetical protein